MLHGDTYGANVLMNNSGRWKTDCWYQWTGKTMFEINMFISLH